MSVGRGRTSRSSAGHELSAVLVIAQRDVIKLLRDRPRLAVNLAFPILLVAGLGNVLQASVGQVTGLDAVTLAFTGVLAATLFQSAAAGMPAYLNVVARALPLRYAVDLNRAAFYAGSAGYGRVVTERPLVDATVVGGLMFSYRERSR